MLKELCNGIEGSKCILIKDSIEQSGCCMFLSLVEALSQRVDRVVLFCWEKPPRYYSDMIPTNLIDKIDLVDCTTDPANWLDTGGLTVDMSLTSVVDEHLKDGDKRCGVAVDSLTLLLLHHPAAHTCQELHRLKQHKTTEQVISLVHTDIHSSHEITTLEHTANTSVSVTSSPSQQYNILCSIVHRRVSGKVIKSTELVKLDGSHILSTTDWQQQDVNVFSKQTETTDPAANLTFNLTLSDQEKEARKHVVLPYTIEQTRQHTALSSSSAKIYYAPDEADDFDEEDPDDDLDI